MAMDAPRSESMTSTLPGSVPTMGGHQAPTLGDLALEIDRARVYGALFGEPVRRRLGRYVVVDVLGHGGMGVVFKGHDEELDRPVALKVLHEDLGPQHTARLRREAQAMAKLSHPHVVQVYEVGEAEGRAFVAMELVRGQTVQAWLQREPRPGWRACVKVFLQLGEGLAAAHAQGLVHRDFKPGNAIIDEQDRARVLDFGIARRGEGDASSVVTEPTRAGSQDAAALEPSLTRTGAILGTPAYMPLEQMSGLDVDARSDQFSFCVALYEAVYGERPYEGDSLSSLLVSMQRGAVRATPKGSPVPVALRAVLLRGLASEPHARWPSMEALLDQLRRVVAPRSRRLVALSVAVVGVSLGGSWAFGQYVQSKDRCTGAEAKLGGVWDEGRKQEAEAAILGTGLSYAEDTWGRVEPRLDEYADRWVTEHVAVCEATSVREEQSAEVMDLRMACLEDRRVALRAAVGVLASADATVVENAVELAAGLPELERCDDVEALRAAVPLPEDPEVAERVKELRERLAEIRAEQAGGRYTSTLEEADSVVKQAEALEHEPLVAEAQQLRGTMLQGSGQYTEAETELREAYVLAMQHQQDEVALAAIIGLTYVVGHLQARHLEGLVWGEVAVAQAMRARDDRALATSLRRVGVVLSAQGKYDQAKLYHERALRLIEETQASPSELASTLDNLAIVLQARGEPEQALLQHERALELREQSLGADHPAVAESLINVGLSLYDQGNHEQALRYYERALRIREQALRPDHPDLAMCLVLVGTVLHERGELEHARRHYQRALQIGENALGVDHPQLALIFYSLGNVLREQGELEPAKRHYERALRIGEKTLGLNHALLPAPLLGLAELALDEEDFATARARAERAVSIWEQGEVTPELAKARFLLARALWPDPAERPRARALAQQARDTFAERGADDDHRAEVERWLAERG